MEDIKKKKKKFSFLASLGFNDKAKNPADVAGAKEKSGFYVGTAEDAIKKRKAERQKMLKEMGS
jgi:hypothetical protein